MRLLRAAERVATPWKNGGGTTTEVAAFPAGSTLDNFGWRVSIAEVRSGGPFSLFPGVDRQLAVLAGRLSLRVEGRAAVEIAPGKAAAEFSGDASTSAEPIGGTVFDLNVMTRHAEFMSQLAHHTAGDSVTLETGVLIVVATTATRVAEHDLLERDALLIDEPGTYSVEHGKLIAIRIRRFERATERPWTS